MNQYVCDKCGADVSPLARRTLRVTYADWSRWWGGKPPGETLEARADLCPECSRALKRWLSPEPARESAAAG